jgi:TorA maturation chaperone TorD
LPIATKKPKKLDKFESKIAARLFAYKFLSRVYLEEPNKDFINIVMSNGFLSSFPYKKENEQIQVGITLVNKNLSKMKESLNLDDLITDYTHLFIGPDKLPSPPWESVYRGEKRLVFGDHTIQVRRAYQEYNLLPERLNQEPDDHIGYELDFMYHLNEKIIRRLKKGDMPTVKKMLVSQKNFLNEHLGKWIADFTADVEKNAWSDFFKGFAKILLGFIKQEKVEINSLLRELRGGSASREKKIKIQEKKTNKSEN